MSLNLLKCAFLVLVIPTMAIGQERNFSYTPSNLDSLNTYLHKITQRKVDAYNGKYRKKAKKRLEESTKSIIESIEDSTFIFDNRLTRGLNRILREIYITNPQIDPKDFYFLINQSPVPNASCYGNGLFTINNGLFSLVESDDELAFILCHEFAHLQLGHNDISLENYFDAYESKETEKKVDKISGERYGKFSKARELFKDLKYNLYQKSRKAEAEADSLGLQLFLKTGYNPSAGVSMLEKLDFDEKAILNELVSLETYLTSQNYPFKPNWLQEVDNRLFDLDEVANDYQLDKDSIKTHPDILKRVEWLKATVPSTTKEVSTSNAYMLKDASLINNIQASIETNRLDVALYYLLSLYQKQKIGDTIFYPNTARVFTKLYTLKKTHQLGKYIAPISPFSEEKELNKIRRFIQNIEPKNIRKLGYWFCVENKEHFKSKEEYLELFTFFQKLNPNLN